MRVSITNPLYRKSLTDQQDEKFGDRFQLFSPWSDWVEVQTLRERYLFLTSASKPPFSQASIEIWQFSSGTWRKARFSVTAGDPIGSVTSKHEPLVAAAPTDTGRFGEAMETVEAVPIDFSTGTHMVDLDFRHRARVGMIERPSPRLLYLGPGGEIRSRHLVQDTRRRREVEEMIIESNPQLKAMREAEEARRAAEAESRRAERQREREERANRSRSPRDRDRRPTGPEYGPEYGPPPGMQ